MRLPLVKAHRVIAVGLGLFIITHLAVHLTAIGGPDIHIAALSKIQPVYRNWIIEPILVLAILTQVFIGGKLVWRRWKSPQKGFWGWTQILSGGYLAVFLLVHSSAALTTRYIVGLDTNFYWAASTLNIPPLQFFFAPYYMLGILSVFAHLAAAIYFGRGQRSTRFSGFIIGIGGTIAVIILAAFGGVFYDINIPQEYIDYFETYTG